MSVHEDVRTRSGGRGAGVRYAARLKRLAALLVTAPLLSGCILTYLLPLPSTATRSSPAPIVPPSPGPSASPLALIKGTVLGGAPAAAVWNLIDTASIHASRWESGGGLQALFDVPRLEMSPNLASSVRVSVSPLGNRFLVTEYVTVGGQFLDSVRIVDVNGHVLWARQLKTQATEFRWSPNGTRVAMDLRGHWLILTFHDRGAPTVSEVPTARPKNVNGSFTNPWMLVGFSADGRWLYGGDALGGSLPFRVTVRASVLNGKVERIARLPTDVKGRLAFPPSFDSSRVEQTIDPGTGRVVTGSCGVGDACNVSVWGENKAVAFDLPTRSASFSSAWHRGSLIALWTRGVPGQQKLHLSRFSLREGDLGKVSDISTFPEGSTASFAGLADGWVMLAYGTGAQTGQAELVLVRLADGGLSVVQSSPDVAASEMFGFAGWLPDNAT